MLVGLYAYCKTCNFYVLSKYDPNKPWPEVRKRRARQEIMLALETHLARSSDQDHDVCFYAAKLVPEDQ